LIKICFFSYIFDYRLVEMAILGVFYGEKVPVTQIQKRTRLRLVRYIWGTIDYNASALEDVLKLMYRSRII